jgi:hypothetical protein
VVIPAVATLQPVCDVSDPVFRPDVVAKVDLFSVDHVAGDNARRRWETSVEFRQPTVERVDAATRHQFARQVDIDRWELNYVTLPFDLLPLDHGHYAEIRMRVRFDRPDVVAKYLAPDEGNKRDVPFHGTARASGLGGPAFGWTFTPAAGKTELIPRGHLVLFLLQRPREPTDYHLTLDVDVEIMRQAIVISRRVAKPQRPGRYRLSFADGTFVPLPS